MLTPRRTTVATSCLAVLLAAGCTADTEPAETEPADTGAAAENGSSSPTPAGEMSPSPAETTSAGGGAVTFESLTGEATRLSVDQRVVDALGAIGVELSAVGGAQTESGGGVTTFTFPISGGDATVDPAAADPFDGTVQHEGALQLSALGRSVSVEDLVLNGDRDQLTGTVAGRDVTVLPLVTDADITPQDDQVTISYSPAPIDSSAVDALTEQFGGLRLPDIQVNELETTLEGS